MAHAIWKGAITFGLINVPVGLYSAEAGKQLHFKMLDKNDMSPIGYKYENKVTHTPVSRDEIIKAFEIQKGEFVTMTDEDFKKANVESTQAIEIQDFVDQSEIDPLFYSRPYYLAPLAKAEKGYLLLRETLKRTGKVAVTTVVMHAREHLALLMVRDEALVLHTMRFYDELKSVEDLELPRMDFKKVKVHDRELKMAEQLVESMTGEWKPQKYHDRYREDLMKLIEYKASHGNKTPVVPASNLASTDTNVIDMVALLKKSIAKSKGKKDGRRVSRRSS